MAHHKSAKKRIKTNLKANLRNRQYASRLRTMMRKVRESQDETQMSTDLRSACALLDRLVTKGILHRNTAARRKSRLHTMVAHKFQPTA
ncbi:30S ribosomal protein S20 [Calditrichota bacterium]